MTLREIFIEAASASGLTDAEISRRSGVSTVTLSRWRSGKYSPDSETLGAVLAVFGYELCAREIGNN